MTNSITKYIGKKSWILKAINDKKNKNYRFFSDMWHDIATDKMRKFLNNGVSKKLLDSLFSTECPSVGSEEIDVTGSHSRPATVLY